MTIPSTPSEVSYAGDGMTTDFPIPFAFTSAADLKVFSTDADGNISSLTTGWSTSGGGGSTGTLTFAVAPAATVDITILDDPEIKQATNYVSNDPFPAQTHEGALDYLTRIGKRLATQIGRALRTADGDPITDLTLGSVDNRKGKYLFFNAVTGAIEYAVNLVTTTLSQSIIAQLLNPQTAAEADASVDIWNYAFREGQPERYGEVGTADDTVPVQKAIDVAVARAALSGCGEVILTADYIVSALTLSGNDVTIHGGGTLVKLADVDGQLLLITGDRNTVRINIDGTADAPTPGSANDTIRVQGGADNVVEYTYINGSQGSGVRFDGGARNKVRYSTILDSYQNNILICNPGADDCEAIGNYCSGTSTGNNIFITADDGSVASGAFVYRNRAHGNTCKDAFDTGIESGYHSVDSDITHNTVDGSRNPPILLRDSPGFNVADNRIRMADIDDQSAECGAITVVPHHETASYRYSGKIHHNHCLGAVARTSIYIGGSDVEVEGNLCRDDVTSISAAGVGLAGSGISCAGGVSDVTIAGNQIENFEIGVNLNQDASAVARVRIRVLENEILGVDTAINCFNCTFTDSVIRDNDLTKVKSYGVNTVSMTGGSTGEVVYRPGMLNLAGWSGASPVNANPATSFGRVFAAADTTPSVANGDFFVTDSNATTITMFDDGYHGQMITVLSNGAITFDTTGTNLIGSSADLVTATNDTTMWRCYGGTTWVLEGFVDVSADNSGGA